MVVIAPKDYTVAVAWLPPVVIYWNKCQTFAKYQSAAH